MLKKSKVIAMLSVCVMMFGVVQPAFAERSWGQVGEDTAYGGFMGAGTGGLFGALLVGVAVVATGGLAALPLAGGAIAAGATAGATYGAAGGAIVGAAGGKEAVDKYIQEVSQNVAEQGGSMVVNKEEAKNFLNNDINKK